MHRKPLLDILKLYEKQNPNDAALHDLRSFVTSSPDCFKRENLAGHLTGSAFVLSQDKKRVLLTFHAKLKKWLQLGGHPDGETFLHEVAMREAREEGGIQDLVFLEGIIPFDLDIHQIPAHKGVPEHLHYDLRYLLLCKDEKNASLSDESLALEWIPLEKVSLYTQEPSMLRQVAKALLRANSPGKA